MLCSELFLITFEQKASIFLVQFIAKLDVYYRGVLKCNLQLRECRLWCLEPRVLRALRPFGALRYSSPVSEPGEFS